MRKLRKGDCYALSGSNKTSINQQETKIKKRQKQRYSLIAGLLYLLLFSNVHAQSPNNEAADAGLNDIKPLLVGENLPDDFWTREHLFYIDGDTVRKNLQEYKGKLIVMDFWATWCAICIAQMKDKELLFDKFPNEAKILMVNSIVTKDNYAEIATKQEKLWSSSAHQRFESIIEDDYLHRLFPTKGYPQYVWLGPWGNHIASTMATSVTQSHLEDITKFYRDWARRYGKM